MVAHVRIGHKSKSIILETIETLFGRRGNSWGNFRDRGVLSIRESLERVLVTTRDLMMWRPVRPLAPVRVRCAERYRVQRGPNWTE